jgi:hypothetical protein
VFVLECSKGYNFLPETNALAFLTKDLTGVEMSNTLAFHARTEKTANTLAFCATALILQKTFD